MKIDYKQVRLVSCSFGLYVPGPGFWSSELLDLSGYLLEIENPYFFFESKDSSF